MKESKKTNWILIILAILLVVLPLVFVQGEYGGSDDAASEEIEALNPDYEPWFESLWEPPSGEIESLLFGLQAAIGAGAIGYIIGSWKGAASKKESK